VSLDGPLRHESLARPVQQRRLGELRSADSTSLLSLFSGDVSHPQDYFYGPGDLQTPSSVVVCGARRCCWGRSQRAGDRRAADNATCRNSRRSSTGIERGKGCAQDNDRSVHTVDFNSCAVPVSWGSEGSPASLRGRGRGFLSRSRRKYWHSKNGRAAISERLGKAPLPGPLVWSSSISSRTNSPPTPMAARGKSEPLAPRDPCGPAQSLRRQERVAVDARSSDSHDCPVLT